MENNQKEQMSQGATEYIILIAFILIVVTAAFKYFGTSPTPPGAEQAAPAASATASEKK